MINAYCTICTENLTIRCEISVLFCGHVFHKECLKKWMDIKRSCPNCRNCEVNNYIDKIFFDEQNGMNSSMTIASLTDEKFKNDYSNLLNQHKECQNKLHNITKSNKEYVNKIKKLENSIKIMEQNKEMELSNNQFTLMEMDEKHRNIEKKLDKFRYLNKILMKSGDDISKIQSQFIPNQTTKEEYEMLASGNVLLKSELNQYKSKVEELSLELSRCQMKLRLLEEKEETRQRHATKLCDESQDLFTDNEDEKENKSDVIWRTPVSNKKQTNLLSTPFFMMQSSPDTPASVVRQRRMHAQTVASNPFGSASNSVLHDRKVSNDQPHTTHDSSSNPLSNATNKNSTHQSKNKIKLKKKFSLDHLTIMTKHLNDGDHVDDVESESMKKKKKMTYF